MADAPRAGLSARAHRSGAAGGCRNPMIRPKRHSECSNYASATQAAGSKAPSACPLVTNVRASGVHELERSLSHHR